MKLAERMSRLGTETAFEVLAKAKALEARGQQVIHLEIGEPDFDTPRNIIDAAIKALNEGKTHYSPAAGISELREVLAEDIGKRRNIKIQPDQVVVTPGAKPIMFFTILALVDEGDEVMYPNPGFPIYESIIDFVGAKSVPYPLREEKEFRFDIDEFMSLISDRTKLIILNTPQNPTGGILTESDLKAVAQVAQEKDIYVLSDEVYMNIIYEGVHHSIASLPGMQERTIILDGFSKTYAMTGWRLGYGAMPKDLADKVVQLQINSNSCTATFSQYAGIEAIRGPQDAVYQMVAEFKKRRDVIVDGLNAIPGLSCLRPHGAFYVFPNIKQLGIDGKKFADLLLEKFGVAVLSGTAFGKYGNGYLRLSYANSIPNIEKALDRIEQAVKSIKA
ncbi:MAG: pyridoxal phosphate-dependent aminotransferase [candidate division KSB1 bacterium]|nr:pyridoxal phosphate-dependent aminotransferase [candidate division KSB1 bacterium]MDZ7334446.1 pyridoxal phosphate-dependent aminotransferase [candidate division KSB1 bacterium]MDZ7355973.1 pyridoxal phosphate-dependent aminotransferase [candidate division KSB1 bacterium]MDZ7375389.1 pyridoxal phosphate-dependent aminotransferase [candidate division KSB1 bacterium]MDZ7400693.1 pyridoxal phosphate-dependent aminotransferase [candidate division KSB1 bacterium]